jgi:hypothetical protein
VAAWFGEPTGERGGLLAVAVHGCQTIYSILRVFLLSVLRTMANRPSTMAKWRSATRKPMAAIEMVALPIVLP